MIQDLDRISDAHLQWINSYNRTLLCGLQPGPEIIAENAHHHCDFGNWYRLLDPAFFQSLGGQLKQIGEAHRYMHESAASLVQNGSGEQLDTKRYDCFTDHAYRFKTGVRALQMKLIREWH